MKYAPIVGFWVIVALLLTQPHLHYTVDYSFAQGTPLGNGKCRFADGSTDVAWNTAQPIQGTIMNPPPGSFINEGYEGEGDAAACRRRTKAETGHYEIYFGDRK